jgi:hypothetical protein
MQTSSYLRMRDNLLSMGLLQFKPWVRLERKGT